MATLALDPCYLPSILSLGTLYKVKGMLLDALAAYTRAHELAPGADTQVWGEQLRGRKCGGCGGVEVWGMLLKHRWSLVQGSG